MKNKVSIIIPVYNGEKYIKFAIQSALDQTYKNIEIIVVNDGSYDNTEKICKSFGSKICYYKKNNGGVSSALNFGISKMKGNYFSWLSHDDLYNINKIDKQINYIKKNNLHDMILYSDYELINESGNHISNIVFDKQIINKKPEYTLLRGFVNGITMLIPKKAFEVIGVFDENRKCSQDYDLWRKMIQTYKFVHMPEILVKTRIHSDQDTNSNPNVIKEGNPLWIDMIDNISDERKIELEGSIFNYYLEMSKFLSNTVYKEAMKHCINKCDLIDINLSRKKIKLSKTKNLNISKFINFYKKHRIIEGTKILLKRMFKRRG